MTLPSDLANRLRGLARTPLLLVATDYDGTLAPIVEDPLKARPLRESSAALRALAGLANTAVAIISGRALRDLAALSRLPEEIHLVGSHGSEFDVGFVEDLSAARLEALAAIEQRFAAIAGRHEGAFLEAKPASVALHYRRCAPDRHDAIPTDANAALEDLDDVQVKLGKKVVEALVVRHNKGTALDRLRHRLAAEAVLFLGDDATDEEAFQRLAGPDLGIKVGAGETAAEFRVGSPKEVAEVLGLLCEEREKWMEGGGFPAIESLSFLSNGRTTAMLSKDARVLWLCHPRPHSAAVFAELLGGAAGGVFAVRPEGDGIEPPRQRYLADTFTVETAWETMQVVDFLERPAAVLHRLLNGQGAAVVEFAPRPDFGRSHPLLEVAEEGILVSGGLDQMALRAPDVAWTSLRGGRALGRIELKQGASAELELRLGSKDLSPRQAGSRAAGSASERAAEGGNMPKGRATQDDDGGDGRHPLRYTSKAARERTEGHWQSWASKLAVPSKYAEVVRRSALTLKGLCYEPTGAVLAAATTSLPEEVGGLRNWDYRHCWPRDAAMTVQALVRLGSIEEAADFIGWLQRRLAGLSSPDLLRPLYPVDGDMAAPEAVITTLSGYRGSRPVRVGNAAANQAQHDMFGNVLDLMWHLTAAGAWPGTGAPALPGEVWGLVEALAAAAERLWALPDHGTWEERQPPRHHVHSKVMCWMALDRAVRLGEAVGNPRGGLGQGQKQAAVRQPQRTKEGALDARLRHWRAVADGIRAGVLERGWNAKAGAYTVAYGDAHLDAAVLLMGLSGFIDPADERYIATVDAVERHLRLGPIVYRYRFDDGLPGFEGGFFLCACWLVEALHQIGRVAQAERLFEEVLAKLGPTGLLAEQYDPATQRQLGNIPQAYSHLGVINAALRLTGSRG